MKTGKKGVVLAAAAALAAMMAFPAMAADSVGSVDISVYGTFYLGQTDTIEDFEIDTDTDGCYIDEDSTKFTNEPSDGWTDSSKPKLQIVVRLEDTDEYSFSGITKDDVDIDCDYDYSLSTSRSGSRLTVTVTFNDVDFDDDDDDDDGDTSLELDGSEIVWDDSNNGYAYWDALDYARSYELRLYRNDSRVTTGSLSTTDDSFDFGQYMTKEGDYYFEIRAVHGSSHGEWTESEDIYISEDDVSAIAARVSSGSSSSSGQTDRPSDDSGEWAYNDIGAWWVRNDGSYPANQWEKIGGYWFFFNQDGYDVENDWVQWNSETQSLGSGLWYYLGANGVMMENEWTPDNYWVGNDGVWNGKDQGVQ